MKRKRKYRSANILALTSLTITMIGVLWNVFFGYGKLIGRIEAMQEDISKMKSTMIRTDEEIGVMQKDLHKMDLRVTGFEQCKP